MKKARRLAESIALPLRFASITVVGIIAMVFPRVPLLGQEGVVSVSIRDGVTRGDEFHAAFQPAEALESYRGALATTPTRLDALWRAARACVSLGMLADDDDDAAAWYAAAEDFAGRAIAAAPDSAAGYQWRAIALGQQALLVGPRKRVTLSEQIRTDALRTLERDPNAAAAHHVLGQWHAEIERLGGLTRFAAERLLGADTFREASWITAEHHLDRAVELDPGAPIHRQALAQLLLDLDRRDEALVQLRQGAALPPREPTDPKLLTEIRAQLASLGGSPGEEFQD